MKEITLHLASFKELIKQRCGLIFEGVGEAPLVTGLQKRITATGAKNVSAYYATLLGNEHEFHELVCLLTINETYFYREPEQLQLLVDCLIPRILSRKQDASPIRILSAGCSTGEEPYSIAMALLEKYGESAARMFTLAGGDIDKGALEKAQLGRYTEFSFRSLVPELRERYFERHGKWAWNVKNEVRHRVHFHHLNLLAEHYHHALQDFDIIFFRNVSIYFDLPTRRIIQQHLATLLNYDGYLIIGTAETLANDLGVLNLVEENGLYYFAKQPSVSSKPRPQILPKPPEPPARPNALTSWILPSPAPSPLHEAQLPAPNGHGKEASRDDETRHARFPLPNPLPQAGEGANEPLRELHINEREASPQPEYPTIAADLDDALRLTKEKRYDEALAMLAILLEQQPATGAALLLKAHIQLHRKDYAAAEESAQQALATEPWSIDAFVLLGLAAKWRNQPDAAVKWFRQAVYACNECWPAHYYLGELYRADHQTEKARRAYRIVLQLLSAQQTPDDGLSVIPLGLPVSEVRFLCEHQIAKLGAKQGDSRAVVSG